MAQALEFGNDYFAQVAALIDSIENLRVLNDRIAQDSGLIAAYFADPNSRTDIDATAVSAAKDAVIQMLFTFDSGSPTQKAALFNLL